MLDHFNIIKRRDAENDERKHRRGHPPVHQLPYGTPLNVSNTLFGLLSPAALFPFPVACILVYTYHRRQARQGRTNDDHINKKQRSPADTRTQNRENDLLKAQSSNTEHQSIQLNNTFYFFPCLRVERREQSIRVPGRHLSARARPAVSPCRPGQVRLLNCCGGGGGRGTEGRQSRRR